ncbi:MAG: hypothetical protein D6754_02210 [Alphaproteobacteria bacterium]|nr:MAG: hypothetical protein D6754_02210 [Alphaproteobacteria bacterium]
MFFALLPVIWCMLSGRHNSKLDRIEGAPKRFPGKQSVAFIFTALLFIGSLTLALRVWWNALLVAVLFVVLMGYVWLRYPEDLKPLYSIRKQEDMTAAIRRFSRTLVGLVLAGAGLWSGVLYLMFELDGWQDTDRAEGIMTGFGAALVSLAIWGTKEFGNDQRGVKMGIVRAQTLRGKTCPAKKAVAALEREALWDSFADGFFYITGAVLAVGIIASHPDPDTPFFESAWELVSILFFTLVLLVLGQRYAYRSRAIDLIGAPYAFRLGLVESAVEVTRKPELVREFGECPLDRLYHHGRLLPEEADPLRHVVVYGGPGSGKTPFVVSLACEAAMSHIPVDLRDGPVRSEHVRARYTSYRDARLDEADDPIAIRNMYRTGVEAPIFIEGELLWDLCQANFAVIDDIPWSAWHRRVKTTDEAGNEVEREEVWLELRFLRLIRHFLTAHRRYAEKGVDGDGGMLPPRVVWALDPPDPGRDRTLRFARQQSEKAGSIDRHLEHDAAAFAELIERYDALLKRLEARKHGSAPPPTSAICVSVTDDTDARWRLLDSMWRVVNRDRPGGIGKRERPMRRGQQGRSAGGKTDF